MALMGVSRRDLSFDFFATDAASARILICEPASRDSPTRTTFGYFVGAYFTRDPQPLKDPRASTVILIFVSSKPFLV